MCVGGDVTQTNKNKKKQKVRDVDVQMKHLIFPVSVLVSKLTFGKGSNHSLLILPPGAVPHCCFSLPLIN